MMRIASRIPSYWNHFHVMKNQEKKDTAYWTMHFVEGSGASFPR